VIRLGSLPSSCRVTPVRRSCSICSYSHLRSLFALFPASISSVVSVLPFPRCAACICASCSDERGCILLHVLQTILLSLPLAALLVLLGGTHTRFGLSQTIAPGTWRFASAHVIHRPPFECVASAHHTIPPSAASRRAYLHGRAYAHHLTWAVCSHIRGPLRTSCFRTSRRFISSRPSPVRMPRRFVRRR